MQYHLCIIFQFKIASKCIERHSLQGSFSAKDLNSGTDTVMASSLLVLKDFRHRYLCIDEFGKLIFGDNGDCFILSPLGHCGFLLQHSNGLFVTLSGNNLVLGNNGTPIELYADFDRRKLFPPLLISIDLWDSVNSTTKHSFDRHFYDAVVAFKLPTGAFLASQRSTDVLIPAKGPLRFDRLTKLLTLIEVGLPRHVFASWPLRCYLQATSDGLYLSNCHDKLAANVEVPCCTEEIILDMPSIINNHHPHVQFPSHIWSSHATHLVSVHHHTGNLIFRSQHSCHGHEIFDARLSSSNKLRFLHSNKNNATMEKISRDDHDAEEGIRYVTCNWPSASCISHGKPSEFQFELVALKPNFILTAHGCLITSKIPLSWAGASKAVPLFAPPSSATTSAIDYLYASWTFEHHGDCVYSICNAATGHHLYVEHSGALRMDGDAAVQYPDGRTLFIVEAESLICGQDDSLYDGGIEAFIKSSSDQKLVGFTIKTRDKKEGGYQLRLCALPDGRITTTSTRIKASRWELFAIIDKAAAVNGTFNPLERQLQCHILNRPAESHKTGAVSTSSLRRSISCHSALNSRCSNGGNKHHMEATASPLSSSSLSSSPSLMRPRSMSVLPGIEETNEKSTVTSNLIRDKDDDACNETDDMDDSSPGFMSYLGQSSLHGRRCMSESALNVRYINICMGCIVYFSTSVNIIRQHLPFADIQELHDKKPKFLAELRHPPQRAFGWGIKSAASVQDIACTAWSTNALIQHTMVSTLACQEINQQHDNPTCDHQPVSEVPNKVLDVSSLRKSLPDEISDCLGRELELLSTQRESTKLSFKQLHKASMQSNDSNIPSWAESYVMSDAIIDDDMLPEELAESYLCTNCQGSGGLLLPLDPDINPRHHRFLQAMGRRQFGGVRRRRRRGGAQMPDLVSLVLNMTKNGLIFLGLVKCMLSFKNAK